MKKEELSFLRRDFLFKVFQSSCSMMTSEVLLLTCSFSSFIIFFPGGVMKHIHLQVHVGYTDKFATGLETSFQLFLSKAQDLVRKCSASTILYNASSLLRGFLCSASFKNISIFSCNVIIRNKQFLDLAVFTLKGSFQVSCPFAREFVCF